MALGAVWVLLPKVALSAIATGGLNPMCQFPEGSLRLSARRLGGSISKFKLF
jgi:hypothetical protein